MYQTVEDYLLLLLNILNILNVFYVNYKKTATLVDRLWYLNWFSFPEMLHLKADLFQYLDYKIFPKYWIYFYQIYLLIILNLSLFLKFSKNFPKLLQLHFMLSLSIFVFLFHFLMSLSLVMGAGLAGKLNFLKRSLSENAASVDKYYWIFAEYIY